MYLKVPPRKISRGTKRIEDDAVSENKVLTKDNLSNGQDSLSESLVTDSDLSHTSIPIKIKNKK